MNRRNFLKKLTAGAAIALASGATVVTVEGCAFNITDAINTVLNSALAILKVADPSATWVGSLASAIAALQQAETSWQAGGTSTIVIDALNTIEAVLAVIPVTAPFSPLIDILVSGIEAVMAAFGLTAVLTPAASLKRETIVNSPHYNKAVLNGPSFRHPTWQGAYKAQWNAKAVALGLSAARIK
jgi:hypothetical protein